MRFLVEAQLPPALAKWIADKGYSASAVRDQGLQNSDDGSIENFPTASDWVVVTKDEDMVERALQTFPPHAPRALTLPSAV